MKKRLDEENVLELRLERSAYRVWDVTLQTEGIPRASQT
jgi:hypothetical protein